MAPMVRRTLAPNALAAPHLVVIPLVGALPRTSPTDDEAFSSPLHIAIPEGEMGSHLVTGAKPWVTGLMFHDAVGQQIS